MLFSEENYLVIYPATKFDNFHRHPLVIPLPHSTSASVFPFLGGGGGVSRFYAPQCTYLDPSHIFTFEFDSLLWFILISKFHQFLIDFRHHSLFHHPLPTPIFRILKKSIFHHLQKYSLVPSEFP